MTDAADETNPTDQPPERGNWLLFNGCGMLIFLIVGITLAVWYGAASMGGMTKQMTDAGPRKSVQLAVGELRPLADPTREDLVALEYSLEQLSKARRAGKKVSVRVTPRQINAAMRYVPRFAEAGQHAAVEWIDNQGNIKLRVNAPLDGLRGMEGRWFNGFVLVRLDSEGGNFVLEPRQIVASTAGENGSDIEYREAPPLFVNALQAYNWAGGLAEDKLLSPLWGPGLSIKPSPGNEKAGERGIAPVDGKIIEPAPGSGALIISFEPAQP